MQVKHTKNRLVFLQGRARCFDGGEQPEEQAVSVRLCVAGGLGAEMLRAELLDGRV